MMTIKLVAIDMDGTLLNSNYELLASTKLAVKRALKQGVKIVLCSGRPFAGLAAYLKELEIKGSNEYVVSVNGALTLTADGEIVTADSLSYQQYCELTEVSKAHSDVPFNVVDLESKIITYQRDVDFMVLQQAWENKASVYIRDINDFSHDFQLAKASFVGNPQLLDQLEPELHQRFDQQYYITRTDPAFLEIMHPGVNKGRGLAELCKKIGVQQAEVMAIGDAANDLPMFDFAGVKVAMGNASSDVKQAADFVTASNDDDGIERAFNKYLFA